MLQARMTGCPMKQYTKQPKDAKTNRRKVEKIKETRKGKILQRRHKHRVGTTCRKGKKENNQHTKCSKKKEKNKGDKGKRKYMELKT